MMASDLLEHLLEVTPYPPEELDGDVLLAAFQQMHAARQAIMDSMQGLLLDGFDRAGVKELAARQEAWHAALAASMERIRAQRIGTGKLRKYAPSAP
jgi:hypothetical protein